MLIRVRMLGTGTFADPFRAPLPNTIRLIRDDETPFGAQAPRQCIVEIPDADFLPAEQGEAAPVTLNVAGIGLVIRQLDPAHRARIRAFIRQKYRENAASYDVVEG